MAKKQQRKYTGILQFFHNFEHDPQGRTHCTGPPSNPWTIEHSKGKHIISSQSAKGHGRGKEIQRFKFPNKLGTGYDMALGVKIKPRRLLDYKK